MVLTCFDQLDELGVKYVFEGKEKIVSKKQFLTQVSSILKKNIEGLRNIYISKGEKRENLIKLNEENCQME